MSRDKREARKAVGIWIRVSTEDQAKGDSPEHHEHRARCYAEAKGWEIAEVYHLEGVSGKDVSEHPESRRMLKDIESGRITGLIFSKLARLARSTKQLLEFADRFHDAGADLVSLQESIDTSTPAGRLFYTMIAAMAQWEREEIVDRIAASIPIRAKLGKPLGGQAPFGYQWVDKKLVPNPDEVPIRILAHELYREHRRMKTVARLMNEEGYRSRRGNKFSDSAIHRFICDPTPKGLHRANYTYSTRGPNKGELKPEEDWVYNEVEPIMSAELWDECKAIYDAQHHSRKKPAKKTVHLFAGTMYCACGKKMYVPSSSKNYVCGACRNKMPIDDMEHIFIEQIKGFLLSPEEVEGYLKGAHDALAERERRFEMLKTQQTDVDRQIDALFSLHHDGEIPTEGFGARYDPLYARQKEMETQVAQAEAELDLLKVENLSSDHILMEGQTLADRWPKLAREDKRRIVEDLVNEITIGDDEVSIDLLYFPALSPQEPAKRQRTESGSRRRQA